MVKIYVAHHPYTINEDELKMIALLLPYWGLNINEDNEIVGRDDPLELGVGGLSQKAIKDLNQILSHTGIKVYPSPKPDLTVSYNNESTPLSVRIHSVTYRLHPPIHNQPNRVQDHIFKKVWLPKRQLPIHVAINTPYKKYTIEWLSYLLIQYALKPLEFRNLSSFTLEDYQYYVSKYLMRINSHYAAIQQPVMKDLERWPEFPIQPAFSRNQPPPIEEPLFDRSEWIDEGHEWPDEDKMEAENSSEMPIQPFRPGSHNRKAEPINPFKIEISHQSIINPFHKKKDDDL